MARDPIVLWSALLLMAGSCRAGAADDDFAWAAAARALAPADWVGGQVIGFDANSKIGVIALYPTGDDRPTTSGKALEVRLDEGGRPVRSSAAIRDKRPTEHIFFETDSGPRPEDDFEPAPHLPKQTTACSTGGWTNDPDPKGPNLRAGPSAKARIVATLAHKPGPYGIEFHVIGFKGGWFLIEDAVDPDYGETAPKNQRIFSGRGWIAGRLIMSSVASPYLVSSPHDDAGVVLTLSGRLGDSSYGPDGVPIRRILGCNRTWTMVEVEDPPTKTLHTGWVQRLCSNQVTTCP